MEHLRVKSSVIRTYLIALIITMAMMSLSEIGMVERSAAQEIATTPVAEMTPVEVVEQVAPAVVTVINQQAVGGGLGDDQPVEAGAGTGFIIDEEGHVVTNWHVVTGGTSFVVILSDGTEVPAELVGLDPRDDLAVVRIAPEAVPAVVSFGSSEELKPGQSVLAIGSPLGAFTNTVTEGIVSAIGRNQFGSGGVCQNYSNLIQHDAAINPGNSGGPLFNLQGEVIGVNTLGIPQSNTGAPVQGLFFAVPSSTVTEAVQQLIETGTVEQPYIGISFIQLDPALASANDLPVENGIYVNEVAPGSPAEASGLQAEDIIIAMDDQEIGVDQSLSEILSDHQPGDTVALTILRGGQQVNVDLTLAQAPAELFEQCTLRGQP